MTSLSVDGPALAGHALQRVEEPALLAAPEQPQRGVLRGSHVVQELFLGLEDGHVQNLDLVLSGQLELPHPVAVQGVLLVVHVHQEEHARFLFQRVQQGTQLSDFLARLARIRVAVGP